MKTDNQVLGVINGFQFLNCLDQLKIPPDLSNWFVLTNPNHQDRNSGMGIFSKKQSKCYKQTATPKINMPLKDKKVKDQQP
jgi:phosphoribosylformylglycinamidine (FGAM) synthase-like amidotransferase family enzyme